MKSDNSKLSRRNFLLTVGAGGAATAAALVAKQAGQAAPAPAKETRGRGYRETAHTSKYYRSAKV